MASFSADMNPVLDKHTEGTNYSGAGIGRLLDAYESLVTQAELGQGLDEADATYEFDNDLYVRILLSKVVTDPAVSSKTELEPITKKIHVLDERLKSSPKGDSFTDFCRRNSLDML